MTERYTEIEGKTIGYNYVKQAFYITNKGTTVCSVKAQDIYKTATEVFNIQSITLEEIQAFKDTYETLHEIYYTWQDSGAYIKTLQFNSYDKNPIILDCEEKRMYILGSNVIFDLSKDISPSVRVPYLCSYYKDMLGLEIPTATMKNIYDQLIKYYKPTCYNQIQKDEETNVLEYNNTFVLSNYSGASPATYYGSRDPNKIPVYTQVSGVLKADPEKNTFNLALPLLSEEYNIKVGAQVRVQGTEFTMAEETYSANGIYTIESISEDKKEIKATEPIPVAYTFPYIECCAEVVNATITGMSRETKQITLAQNTNTQNLLIGDTITVRHADVSVELETLSLDGTYTITGISTANGIPKLTVAEDITTDFSAPTNSPARLIKGIRVGDVSLIEDFVGTETGTSQIYLINLETSSDGSTILSKLTVSTDQAPSKIFLTSDLDKTYTVQFTFPDTKNSIVTQNRIAPYDVTEDYPPVEYLAPSEEVLVTVTQVDESIQNFFPTGEFLLDDFTQVVAYLGLVAHLVKPTDSTHAKMYHVVPDSIDITSWNLGIEGLNTMTLKGLYSEIYPTS